MKTFVIGDIHGAYKALIQCLQRSNFDYEKDELICLGDVCDGWSQVKESIDELLKVKNIIYILGNHDWWTLKWITKGQVPDMWLDQGGRATVKSYTEGVPETHLKFLQDNYIYYVDAENRIYVHGGIAFNPSLPKHTWYDMLWDRCLIQRAIQNQEIANRQKLQPKNLTSYSEIFVGHTTTVAWGKTIPIHACNVWDLDTGAGYNGKLTIMDVDTKEYWQSDKVQNLYPEEQGSN